MLIAQITDLHVGARGETFFGGYEPAGAVAGVVARLNATEPRPDLVLFTGDLTENPTPEAYAEARGLLAPLEIPMVAVPGNHDDRRLLRETLGSLGARVGEGEFLQLDFEAGPVRMIGLDTVEDALAPGGQLCEARLDWVAARLVEARERPTVMFMHHQPFATGIGGMDRIGCGNGERLAEIVGRNPQVRRVLCGHVHRAVEADWAGTVATICPAVAWELKLDLRQEAEGRHQRSAPGFQLHRIDGEGRFTSHTVFIA